MEICTSSLCLLMKLYTLMHWLISLTLTQSLVAGFWVLSIDTLVYMKGRPSPTILSKIRNSGETTNSPKTSEGLIGIHVCRPSILKCITGKCQPKIRRVLQLEFGKLFTREWFLITRRTVCKKQMVCSWLRSDFILTYKGCKWQSSCFLGIKWCKSTVLGCLSVRHKD